MGSTSRLLRALLTLALAGCSPSMPPASAGDPAAPTRPGAPAATDSATPPQLAAARPPESEVLASGSSPRGVTRLPDAMVPRRRANPEGPPGPRPEPDAEPEWLVPAGHDLDRKATSVALAAAAEAALRCKRDGGPRGIVRVHITFAPNGSATSASVDNAPFAGTAVGECIAAVFRGVHVPPFTPPAIHAAKSLVLE